MLLPKEMIVELGHATKPAIAAAGERAVGIAGTTHSHSLADPARSARAPVAPPIISRRREQGSRAPWRLPPRLLHPTNRAERASGVHSRSDELPRKDRPCPSPQPCEPSAACLQPRRAWPTPPSS